MGCHDWGSECHRHLVCRQGGRWPCCCGGQDGRLTRDRLVPTVGRGGAGRAGGREAGCRGLRQENAGVQRPRASWEKDVHAERGVTAAPLHGSPSKNAGGRKPRPDTREQRHVPSVQPRVARTALGDGPPHVPPRSPRGACGRGPPPVILSWSSSCALLRAPARTGAPPPARPPRCVHCGPGRLRGPRGAPWDPDRAA